MSLPKSINIMPVNKNANIRYPKLVNRYVRQYGFMAQLMDFSDPDLEKFYYLIHNEEMSNDDGKKVTYGNAVHYTDALRRLRNAKKYETYTSDEQRKYAQYLDMVTNWRSTPPSA